MSDNPYLQQLLKSIESRVDKAFDLYEQMTGWWRSHEDECNKRYAELRKDIDELKDLVIDRNKTSRARNGTLASKPPPPTKTPLSFRRSVLKYIGDNPLVIISALLIMVLALDALARINPEILRAILGIAS